jgi:hypothetical protein
LCAVLWLIVYSQYRYFLVLLLCYIDGLSIERYMQGIIYSLSYMWQVHCTRTCKLFRTSKNFDHN